MYNARWDDRPAEYAGARDCWLTRGRTAYVAEFLRNARPGERVLDVGSGVAELAVELAARRPDLRFIGVDAQATYVEFATAAAASRRLPNVAFRVGLADDLTSLFSSEARFEWILSNDMLCHVSHQERVPRAVSAVATATGRWLAVELNWLNPYVLLACAIKPGERDFWPRPFLASARASGWSLLDRSFLFLIPPFVKRPPRALIDLEPILETNPLLAGGVAIAMSRCRTERSEP